MPAKATYDELVKRVHELEKLVAEQEKTTEQLHSEQEQFRLLYERAPLSYQSLDENGNFIQVNQAWLDTLGYTSEEVIGRSFADFLHPEWQEHFKENFPRFKAVGEVLGVEFNMLKKNGDTILVSFHGKIGRNNSGDFQQTHCIFQDITQKADAEEALLESQDLLTKTQEIARIGSWHLDLARNVLTWSQENYRIFGVPAGTALSYETFLRCVHPEDREYVNREWSASLLSKKYDIEHRLLAGSEVKWVREKAELQYDEIGNCIAAIGFTHDITEQKSAEIALVESETRFRSLFQNMYAGVAIYRAEDHGEDFILVDMNQSGEMLSQVKKHEIVGRRVTECFPAIKEMGLFHILQRVHQSGRTEKLPMQHYDDGRLSIWVDNTVFRLPTQEVVCVFRDETERHLAEEEIKNLNKELEQRVIVRTKQLEEANQELEDFVYSVSHDLRAPLRSISGFAEIIERRHKASLNEEGQHYFSNIIKASEQMGDLIEDLLSFSRLGRKSIRTEQVSLQDVVENAYTTLAGEFTKSGSRLEVSEDLPAVTGDRGLLVNIFTNLLDNAIKYRQPEVPALIKVRVGNKEPAEVIISIGDNGIGIEPEYHQKIFKIFQRLHNQETYPGTGIGLAAVKKGIHLMGGKVWVESTPGIGSVFHLKIPSAAARSTGE